MLLSGFLYRKAQAGLSPFAAVNGAIEGLVKALAVEVAPIRVNGLAPGRIDTTGDLDAASEAAAGLPLGRIGVAEEAAHAAPFLAENTFTTGITLDVDGGER